MQQTLAKVKNLEIFLQRHGDEPVISRTIAGVREYDGEQEHAD
ncbi:MAG: hypothetical protein AB1632_02910 [Nitrospirota bacterium]